MTIKIKKASGIIEDFNPDKLVESLIRSGAEREHAEEVLSKVIRDIKPHTSTKKIFRLARKYLKQFNRSSVLRYSLKEALMRLGPTGYPFEKYVGELLKQYGYTVDVGIILDGKCVRHEVDVFARREKEVSFIECKYRNNAENAPDVKTAMYVHSRFLDLSSGMKPQYPDTSFSGWLVTNTRFTADAIQYARCTGLTLKSWRYPGKESLENMIEEKKLYPVTVVSGLTSQQIQKLFGRNIVLMRDLAQIDAVEIRKLLSITERKAVHLKEEADRLCFC